MGELLMNSLHEVSRDSRRELHCEVFTKPSQLRRDLEEIKQKLYDIAQKLTYIAANFHKTKLTRGDNMDEMLQFLEYIRDKYSDVLEVEDLDYIDSLTGEDIEDFRDDIDAYDSAAGDSVAGDSVAGDSDEDEEDIDAEEE